MTNHENTHDTANLSLVLGGTHAAYVAYDTNLTLPGVDQAPGQPGRDFSEYARVTAATDIWSA